MSYLKLTLALVLVICAASSVQAWDLGVVTSNQIKFYSSKTANNSIDAQLNDMFAIAYDHIKKDIYVSDGSHKLASIFRIKTTGKTAYNIVEPIVVKQTSTIQGMAFDHRTSRLYWTTGLGKSINFVQVPENLNMVPLIGEVLINFETEIPIGIAIDSCRGYLYWANCNHLNASIERSRLDGSNRQVLVHKRLYRPLGVAIDVKNNILYWNEFDAASNYSIECSNLYIGSRRTLLRGFGHQPLAIALDDQGLYWSDWVRNAVWTVPKNSSQGKVSPTLVASIRSINAPTGLIMMSDKTTFDDDLSTGTCVE